MTENVPSEFSSNLLGMDHDTLMKEFKEGKAVGETARIEPLKHQFTWKRGFVNCWTGLPNFGKSTLVTFLMANKSAWDTEWKWAIWSPEMISSTKINGTVQVSAGDIQDELIHMYIGKHPYKHFEAMYGIPQMTEEEYQKGREWVEDHFYIFHPKDKNYKTLIDNFMWIFETIGVSGWLIDPFKNVRYESFGTTDIVLSQIFDEFKDCAVMTDSSVNIVAHPKSNNEPKKKVKLPSGETADGAFKVVTQYNLLGGSAWDSGMDGIFSIHRPFAHIDSNDPTAWLYHLKQRKKHLVGNTGVFKGMEFDQMTNRYYFDARCPIDGEFKQAIVRDEFGVPLEVQPTPQIMGSDGEPEFVDGENSQSAISFTEEKIDEPAF